jgi:RNA polymerase sigma factor (TIGR02999 family)
MSDITRVLHAAERGEPQAATELLPLVYEELRKLAAQKMAGERAGHTLQPTSLVHEAWLRLGGGQDQKWDGRGHFFAAAAEAMRRILIDKARRKNAQRHGGGKEHVDFDEVDIAAPGDDEQLLAVHEALNKLAAEDERKAELVKLRYFVGMTIEEAAQVMGISEPTAKRYWTYARAWLYQEIKGSAEL